MKLVVHGPTDGPRDGPTNMTTYRAAIVAKNKDDLAKMTYITISNRHNTGEIGEYISWCG